MRNFALRGSRLLIAASIAAFGLGLAAHAADDDSATTPAATWPGGTWSPPAATYGSKLDRQVSVTMSDGVVLKADISYPTDLAGC